MFTERDTAWMPPDERRRELANLRVRGVRRLRDRHVLYPTNGDVSSADLISP